VALPGVGTITRLFGLCALALAALTTVVEGRVRKPDAIFLFAIVFTFLAALSLLWTVSVSATFQRLWTYIQLLGAVWMIREFARSHERQQALLLAYCLGAIIPIVAAINNFTANSASQTRFAMAGFNANDLGLTLAIGLAMAWHLALRLRGWIRGIPVIYLVFAPIVILLTGSRGSVLAATVALSIVPLTFRQWSLQSVFLVGVAMVAAIAGASVAVPDGTWDRIGTIETELTGGGTMTGRTEIWKAGLEIFPERPLLGVGAGAFGPAIERAFNLDYTPHNTPLAILVEHGAIGFLAFAALLGACATTIARFPRAERILWGAVMLCWLVGGLSVHWHYRKVTWLLFGLLAAQGCPKVASLHAVRKRIDVRSSVRPVVLHAVSSASDQRPT
jgi:O-antigen ligase